MVEANIVTPTKAQAEAVIRWLKNEHFNDLNGKKGFYCNRDAIRRAARESNMKCLTLGRSVIAFSVFGPATIDIFEVHPNYRRKGYGRQFAGQLIQELFSTSSPDISIECVPQESEHFWRALGFVDQDERYQCWGTVMLVLRRP